MRQSQLFSKTLREPPKDEVSFNARLLSQAGFIFKEMAGVYSFLPLGFRVLGKIKNIIREEMDALGGQEMFMTVLQNKEIWEASGRWQTLQGDMYQLKDRTDKELGLGFTHEEPISNIAKNYIRSYRDLPLYLYQIQDKFRDEPRARSGLIRLKEFIMKDLYSFHEDEKDLKSFYEKVKTAYGKIFKRIGLEALIVEASGGTFTPEFTHEFQVLSDSGEDKIIYCPRQHWAQNLEIAQLKESDLCPIDKKEKLQFGRSIEIGNIFKLGTKFSEAFGLYFVDKKNQSRPVWMGSYGIGPNRIMGTIVEASHDENGIIWPESVAPFKVHFLALAGRNVLKEAEILYKKLLSSKVEVLYDDREETAGVKLVDADLLGIPERLVLSEKTLKSGAVEFKNRGGKKVELIKIKDIIEKISS